MVTISNIFHFGADWGCGVGIRMKGGKGLKRETQREEWPLGSDSWMAYISRILCCIYMEFGRSGTRWSLLDNLE